MCARVCSGTSAGYYHPEMLVNIHFFKKKIRFVYSFVGVEEFLV